MDFIQKSFRCLNVLESNQRIQALNFQSWIQELIFDNNFKLEKPKDIQQNIEVNNQDKQNEEIYDINQKKRIENLKERKAKLKIQNQGKKIISQLSQKKIIKEPQNQQQKNNNEEIENHIRQIVQQMNLKQKKEQQIQQNSEEQNKQNVTQNNKQMNDNKEIIAKPKLIAQIIEDKIFLKKPQTKLKVIQNIINEGIKQKNKSQQQQKINDNNIKQSQQIKKYEKKIQFPRQTNYQYLAGNICQQISFLYQNFVIFNSLIISDFQKKNEKLLVILDDCLYVKKKMTQKKFQYKVNQYYHSQIKEIKSKLQKNQLLYNNIKKYIDFFPIFDFEKDKKICVTKIGNNKIDFKYSLINYINYDLIMQQFENVFFIYIIEFEDIIQQRVNKIEQIEEFFINFYGTKDLQQLFQKSVIIYVTGTINNEQQQMFINWIKNHSNIFIQSLEDNIQFSMQQNLDSIVKTCFNKEFIIQYNNPINMYFFDSQIDSLFIYLRQFEQEIVSTFQNFSVNELENTFNNLNIILDIFLKSINDTVYEFFLKPISQIWLFMQYIYLKIFTIYQMKKQFEQIKQIILENIKILDNHDNFMQSQIELIQQLELNCQETIVIQNKETLQEIKNDFIKKEFKLYKKEIESFFNEIYETSKQKFQFITQRYQNNLNVNENLRTPQCLMKINNQIEISEMLHARLNHIILVCKNQTYSIVYDHDIENLQDIQLLKVQKNIQNQNQISYQKVIKKNDEIKFLIDKVVNGIQNNNSIILEKFLEQYPDEVNSLDSQGKSMFYYAITNNSLECIQILRDYNAIFREEEFILENPFKLIMDKQLDKLKNLLQKNIDINCFQEFKFIHKNKINLLMLSVYVNSIDIFECLIQQDNININSQNDFGESVLHFCCLYKKEIFLDYLINLDNCDVNLKQKDGKTPLYICVENDFLEGIKSLKTTEVNLKERFENDNSLLHICVNKQKIDILKILLININKADYKNENGDTPFHLALRNEDRSMIYLLVDYSDLELKNSEDKTPLVIAFDLNNLIIIGLLINKKANINKKNNQGKTLLHLAVEQNWISLVRLLIQNNAQINKQDEQGNTPLHIAYKKFNKKIIKLLEHNEANQNARNVQQLIPKQMKPQIRPDMFKVKEKRKMQQLIQIIIMNQSTIKFFLLNCQGNAKICFNNEIILSYQQKQCCLKRMFQDHKKQ